MKKLLTLTGAVTIVLILLMACGSTNAMDENLTLLLSRPDLALPFSGHTMKVITDYAAKLGNIGVVVSDRRRSSPKQSADIKAAVAEGVGGIIINSNDSAALAPAIREAISAGIPAVIVDCWIGGADDIFGHVGADNVEGGELQGPAVDRRWHANQHLPGAEVWLMGEHHSLGERNYYPSNLPLVTTLRQLA